MPFNGSGTFQRIYSWVTDAANGVFVSSSRTDTDTNDIATGLSTCITKDGQTVVTSNIPMAGFKITGLGLGTGSTDAAAVNNANARSLCEGRLTLTTGVPVTTSDVTAAETLYFTPYKGSCIAVYDGTNWQRYTFTQLSIDVPDVTGMHDVFIYDNSGTLTLEVLVWTNDTTRATALTTQDGVLVKTGALTRRYLGSFYSTTAGNGQIEDSYTNRYLWNYYNRVRRPMRNNVGGNWNYTTATWRAASGSATGTQVNFCVGVSEEPVSGLVKVAVANSTAGVYFGVAIGLDTVIGPGDQMEAYSLVAGREQVHTVHLGGANGSTYPGVGRHFLAWSEYSQASGTTTWYGAPWASGVLSPTSGIQGEVWG